MTCYFDTSALIKKYVEEGGSELVREYFNKSTLIVVGSTTRLECFSVLRRMTINREMKADESKYLSEQVVKDFTFFEIVPFNEVTESIAIRMIQKHGLRTLDAIQLASALSTTGITHFLVSDNRLKTSSKAEGFSVIDPSEQ